MATNEKKKGRSRKGVQGQPVDARPGLKQRTLFDSFGLRAVGKAEPELTTAEVPPAPADVASAEQNSSSNGAVITEEPRDEVAAVFAAPATSTSTIVEEPVNRTSIEVLEISDSSPPPVNTTDQTLNARQRSPSVITVNSESSLEVVATTLANGTCTTTGPSSSQLSSKGKKAGLHSEGKSKDMPIVIPPSPIRVPGSTLRPDKPFHPFFAGSKKAKEASPSPSLGLSSPRATSPRKKNGVTGVSPLPAYPDRFSQHVRGPQTTFTSVGSSIPSTPAGVDVIMDQDEPPRSYHFLKTAYGSHSETQSSQDVRATPLSSPNDAIANSIPAQIKANHPAIAHLASLKPEEAPTSRRPWTDKWRPCAAEEVLGNERSAVYLRDWLKALELQWEERQPEPETSQKGSKGKGTDKGKARGKGKDQSKSKAKKAKTDSKGRGTKRPRIIRAIDKSRKKRAMGDQDWIVYSDEEEEEDDYDDDPHWLSEGYEDDFRDLLGVPAEPPASSPSSSQPCLQDFDPDATDGQQEEVAIPAWQTQPSNLGELHNTILLVGPSGSGKTACVYACAEELGWDVFEVHPGIGRRNGASVDNLVGEVGKNHLVLQKQNAVGAHDGLNGFLKKGKRRKDEAEGEVETMTMFSPRKKASTAKDLWEVEDELQLTVEEPTTPAVRQSMILLEEVDILFKEDINFWPTVTKIIKECKRPVICTCNDISLVPTQDLPLQSTLIFEPPPRDVASYYLQALCAAEGFSVDSEQISSLYAEPVSRDPRRPEEVFLEPHVGDLRGTINTLQFLSTFSSNGNPANSELREGEGVKASAEEHGPIKLLKRSEALSFIDGELIRGVSSRYFSAEELADWVPSQDDETGHAIVHDQHAPKFVPFEMYDHHIDIALAAMQIARGGSMRLDISQDVAELHAGEEKRRRVHQGLLNAMLEIRSGVWWRCDASIATEFRPNVQLMLEGDDRDAEKELERRLKMPGSRTTSNSNKFERAYELSSRARRGLGCGELNV